MNELTKIAIFLGIFIPIYVVLAWFAGVWIAKTCYMIRTGEDPR